MEAIPASLGYEGASSENRDIPMKLFVCLPMDAGAEDRFTGYHLTSPLYISNIEGIKQHLVVYNKCSTTPLTGGTLNPTDKPNGRESALHALLVARIRYAVMESGLDAGLVCAAGRAAFMRMTAFSMARGGSNA